MLHDLKGNYIRREEPRFESWLAAAGKIAVLWLGVTLAALTLLWASLRFGAFASTSDPTTLYWL
jgi:hypothetical protein